MRKELRDQIHQRIIHHSAWLQENLPAIPGHGPRNAIAHCYWVLQFIFGCPLGEARDCRFHDAIEIIDSCVDHATDPDIHLLIKRDYVREPEKLPPAELTFD